MKFIMARIFAYIDNLRLGNTEATLLTSYLNSGIEIEHIMPQTCDDKNAYGLDDDSFALCVNQLGNLTLLENSINKSIHNDDYKSKCSSYQQSKFYLTRSIPQLVDQGENTAITRTNTKLKAWSEWSGDTIQERQQLFYKLSEEIWGITIDTDA